MDKTEFGMRTADASPEEFLPAPGPGQRPDRHVERERRRMAIALLLSLLVHLPLLSLTFGGDGQGLPGFSLPWQVRRGEVPDLQVLLLPARKRVEEPAATPAAEPLKLASVERPVAIEPVAEPPAPAVTAPARSAVLVDRPGEVAPASTPAPAVIAMERSEESTWVAPATPAAPEPVIAEPPSLPNPGIAIPAPQEDVEATRARVEQEAKERAVELARVERARQEAQRQAEQEESARKEAASQEVARQEAAKQEAAKLEAAKQEAARQEAARQEAARQEAARQAAARQEIARQEAARAENARLESERQEAARQAAARQEAARQEAARQESARQESARQDAARQEAAKLDAAKAEAAKREERLRAIGRQLNEEAAKREAASRLPHSVGSARRGRLFGRADTNAELVRYAEAWERKIQLNMTFDLVRDAAKQPHTNPTVTVAVRSDGSVESVTFVVSSGVPALDEAIRRVVQSQERYAAFPSALAREYDVIEIRRTWHFDMAIRLY